MEHPRGSSLDNYKVFYLLSGFEWHLHCPVLQNQLLSGSGRAGGSQSWPHLCVSKRWIFHTYKADLYKYMSVYAYIYTQIYNIYIHTHISCVYISVHKLGGLGAGAAHARRSPNLLIFPPCPQSKFRNSQKNLSKPTNPPRLRFPPQECDVGTGGLSLLLLHGQCWPHSLTTLNLPCSLTASVAKEMGMLTQTCFVLCRYQV